MKNKKGISLIVLVITIIVMIILASAIILSLNNAGIIENANKAVEMTNDAQVQQIAQLGWAEAYTSGSRTVEGENGLEAGVKNALVDNNLNPDDYLIHVTTSGVTIKLLEKAWIQDGFTVVRGEQVVEIGDVIKYDAGVSTYTGGWKVLGADEEGNLLIMSAANIKDNYILGDGTLADAQQDWINAPSILDKECTLYGKGKGALGARSITREDVNKVTGYQDGEHATVTYSYNGTTKPSYATESNSGSLGTEHSNGFYYYNGTRFVLVDDLTEKSEGTITSLTGSYAYYSAADLDTISATDNSKAYSMLFGNNDSVYWLATTCLNTNYYNINYSIYSSYSGYVIGYVMCTSQGTVADPINDLHGIRAVVTLSSDLELTGNSTNGWNY